MAGNDKKKKKKESASRLGRALADHFHRYTKRKGCGSAPREGGSARLVPGDADETGKKGF